MANPTDTSGFVGILADVVQELTEISVNNNIVSFGNDNEAQAFMGEALTYALDTAVNTDDDIMTEQSMIQLMQEVAGSASMQDAPQRMNGRLVTEGGAV